MKLMWFHLMPYTELPDDFREKHPSVWVDIHSSLFDPRRAHHMYNDFMDELEFAAECGFDAICVNEHHSNGYGLMPSPNLIASSLARRTTDTAICVMGNSLGALQPADPGRRGIRDDRLHLGRAPDRRLPGRHADGHLLRLRPEPEHAARALSRGARPRGARRGPSPTPSPSTAASTSSATSTSGRARSRSRIRRSGFRAAARSRPGSGAPRWTTSTATCPITATRPGRRRWTGSGTRWSGSARTATRIAPASCNSSASPKRREQALRALSPSRPNISTAAACMSTRASPARRATRARRPSAPGSRARCAGRRAARAALRDQVRDAGARDGRDRRRATSSSARPTRSSSS